MQRLSFQFSSKISFSAPVVAHNFRLHILPTAEPEQTVIAESVEVTPEAKLCYTRDAFGNRVMVGMIDGLHEELTYQCSGTVLRDDSKRVAVAPIPCYRYPSALTRPSAALLDWTRGLELKGDAMEVAQGLQQAVHEYFSYTPGATDIRTTAAAAFDLRSGVCQDYAHVYLAVARALGLTARYVGGITVGEGATHAWCEVYIDGHWHGFDPTRNVMVDESYINLATGRDYNDCAPERGVFRGIADQQQTAFMQVNIIE